MLRKRVRLAGFLLLAAFAIQQGANAALVTVLNPSFEMPDLGGDGFTSAITSWAHTAGSSGVFDPLPTQITPTHGDQVAFANPGSVISQVLAATLTANTIYTLSVDVGDRLDTTYGGYTINLYAGATVIATDPGLLVPSGGFLTSTIAYLSPAFGALIGTPLKIELKYGGVVGGGEQTDFDQVRLDAVTVPELASLAVWSVLGLTVVAGAKRRRREAALN